jgi:hypothetical protein
MSRASRMGWAALCVALTVGCNDPANRAPRTLDAQPPLGLENALLYVAHEDVAKEENDDKSFAWILDVAKGQGGGTFHQLPAGTVTMQPRTGQPGQALLLTSGAAATVKDGRVRDAVNSFLIAFDRSGETLRLELSGRYGQLAQSDDGRFVIAYAPSGTWSTADSIAVIDFEHVEAGEPVPATSLRALNGEGPTGVAFAPASNGRRLAMLTMTDAINLIDLEQPSLRDKVLPLKLPNGSPRLRARKVLFHGDRCFVQSDSGSDVLVVRLQDDADSPSGFRASLLTLATDAQVSDIALIEAEPEPRLLALSGGKLRVIDTVTGDGENTDMGAAFTSALPFTGRSPFDDESRPRALLLAPGTTQLGFVDLQPELRGRERSVEIVNLSDGVQDTVLAPDQKLAVVTHASGRVSLVDLEQRTVSLLVTDAAAHQLLVDEDDGARAWIVTNYGSVGVVDLARRSASPLLLNHLGRALVFVPGSTPHVAVTHDPKEGRVTLVDADDPTREHARELRIDGFAH